MNNLKLKRCFFIAAAIALLAVFMTVPAGARDLNWKLKGDYTWNSTSACASATWGFGSTGNPIMPVFRKPSAVPGQPILNPAPGISYNYSVQGVLSFDGHGALDFTGEVLSIILEPYRNNPQGGEVATFNNFKLPAHHYEIECTGTYFVEHESNELGVTLTSCGFVGAKPTQEFNGATLRGRLDTVTGSSIVFLSNTIPTIETVVTDGVTTPVQRICNANGSMVKLSPRKNWFSKE